MISVRVNEVFQYLTASDEVRSHSTARCFVVIISLHRDSHIHNAAPI